MPLRLKQQVVRGHRGGDMPASKYAGFPAGAQTAGLYAGGATTPPANSSQTNTTYKYDGSYLDVLVTT